MSLQISMVLYSEAPALNADAIQKALSDHWPNLAKASEITSKVTSTQQDNILSFCLGASDVAIGIMPAPYPWTDLEGPCATSILWPDAAAALRGHTHHAIVSVRGELPLVELSTLLTQVSAALMASSPAALGVYWANATLVIPKALFFDFAVEVMPHGAPLAIWVDYRVGWNENKTHSSGFTTGLTSLSLMEMEAKDATEPPSELKKRFDTVAQYLLENGPVIKDGDTVGENANEKIRVVYSESSFGIDGTVMRFVYEAPAAKKSWWRRG